MSEWLRNPDVAWEIVDDPAPGVIASGGRASSGGGGGGGGTTTDANLQALGNRLQWRIAPAMASVPSEANKRAIGFDDSGTLIIWLEGDTKRVAIHGGGAANSEGTTTTAGKVFLTFGDGTISGDASRHSQIKLDDGVMVNASLKFDKSVNSVPTTRIAASGTAPPEMRSSRPRQPTRNSTTRRGAAPCSRPTGGA